MHLAHPRSPVDVPYRTGRPDQGVSSTEYSLALTGVAALVLMAILGLGDQLSAMFDCLSEQLGGGAVACSSNTVIDPGGTDPGGTDPGGSNEPDPDVTGEPGPAPVTETTTPPAGSTSSTTTDPGGSEPSTTTSTTTSTTSTTPPDLVG